MKVSACSSCTAPIMWAWTERGARMPLDRDMVFGGNVDLDPVTMLARVVPADPDMRRHTSHFATCPNAAGWRVPT